MSLSELLKEIVATITHRLAEVGPIRQLKREDRGFVISANTPQFEHRPEPTPAERPRRPSINRVT